MYAFYKTQYLSRKRYSVIIISVLRHSDAMTAQDLEKEILHLDGKDAKSFLEYMKRERTEEELALYKEADEFYKTKCKL